MKSPSRALVAPLLSLALLALAAVAVRHELRGHSYRELADAAGALPASALAWAALATVASYALAGVYDLLAARYLELALPPGRALLGGLVGFAFSNTAGQAVWAGAPVRYRLYEAFGLSAGQVTRIALFNMATLWTGQFFLAGLLLAGSPLPLPEQLGFLPFASTRPLGIAALALALAYLAAAAIARGRALRLGRFALRLPPAPLALAQVALGAIDLAATGLALVALLRPVVDLPVGHLLAIFLLALLAGTLSFVPGGLGVFEAALIVLLPKGSASALAPLLVFRAMYYWIPFAVSVAIVAGGDRLLRRPAFAGVARALRRTFDAMAPTAVAISALAAGAVLLVSGATPALPERLHLLRHFLPLVEISHFTASMVGSALLLVAYGLFRRLDSAWWMAMAATLVGAATSLGKGLDYEEALFELAFALLLLVTRKSFYRRGSLLAESFTPGWIVAVVALLAASVWLGLFAHRHLEYDDELWFRFALHADAPRFLRATAGAVALALLFAVARLAGRARGHLPLASEADLDEIAPLVAAAPETTAHLAFTGDKRFLLARERDGFLMYATRGRAWVSMGDPVGSPAARRELAWRFRELADRQDAWAVFYQVRPETLELYLDLGLSLVKLGEEARVELARFSLDGASRKGFRNVLHRFEREGCTLEILPPGAPAALLAGLRGLSDDWLAGKQAREKRFSLGWFDEAYLARCPLALVRREGNVVAFANLWLGGEHEAASVDLMRHRHDAPPGTMDYLFVRLILWARDEGYRWFDLGMAPLAGLEARRLAPAWHRVAGLAYRHGESFYNFQGLRRFKEKFDPVWESRYLASPGGRALPSVLADVAALVGGGFSGIFSR